MTQFTLQAYPQGQVWVRRARSTLHAGAVVDLSQGGSIITVGAADAVTDATAHFYTNVTDPKASILTTLNWDLDIVSDSVPPIRMCSENPIV